MTIVHVYSLTLEVIGIFQIFTLCLILASGASQKNLIIKKLQQPLDPFSYPSNLHTRPHLWQISGGCPDHVTPTYAWEGSLCSIL